MRAFDGAGGVLSYFARHRTAANLLLLVMVVLGLTALPQMRSQFFPDVIIDNVSVNVTWEGAGAEDVDTAIVQLLEPALLTVEGVESTSARSREGSASIIQPACASRISGRTSTGPGKNSLICFCEFRTESLIVKTHRSIFN